MKNEELTALQREALEHLEKARREGFSVSAYARAHGIPAQRIFDVVGPLRRRGAPLPEHSSTGGKFIAVKIAPPPNSTATVCQMLVPGAHIPLAHTSPIPVSRYRIAKNSLARSTLRPLRCRRGCPAADSTLQVDRI